MSNDVGFGVSFRKHFLDVTAALRKDRILIALVTVLAAAGAAAVGKLTTFTTSPAQLVLTPLPLSNAAPEDEFARMLMEPLGMKTAVLICTSDEVFHKTRDKLNTGRGLPGPIKSLVQLRNALVYEITIEKETPYELVYSPILRLTAKAKTPGEAKLMVDTWAETCEQAAEKFQEANQGPPQKAFEDQAEAVRKKLAEAEEQHREFKEKWNILALTTRLQDLVETADEFYADRADFHLEAARAQASAETLQEQKDIEDPKFSLKWTPSDRLLRLLAGKLGTSGPEETGDADADALTVETVNDTYVALSTELGLDLAKGSGARAQLADLKPLVGSYAEELAALQVEVAKAEIEDARLARNIEILEEAYKDAALKREYARIAGDLKQPQLQLLSGGAEWRAPRFRPAISFGFAAGALGFLCAASLSVLVRTIVKPATEA